jgi:hypothetical protein
MELPKFLLGDNTDFPDDIFIIHLDYPRFIINKDDEVEFMEGRILMRLNLTQRWKG